jgi:ATP-dependent exoDNAse (exonuclease V) beta subunit
MEEKNFVVYRSSAGSGKTYSLVKEYLKIVLTDTDNYKKVLAVTFTNKAANEMKSRVMNSLQDFITYKPENDKKTGNLIGDISLETGLSVESIIKNAAIVQQKVLHNYSDFHISTIDSFVQRIIRSFANDLRLSADYEISLDDKSLLYEAVDSIISLTNREKDITNALVSFIEYKTDDDKSWDFDKELKQFALNLLSENFHENMEYLSGMKVSDFVKEISKLKDQIDKIESESLNIAGKAVALISSSGLETNDFYYGSTGLPEYFSKFLRGKFEFIPNNRLVNSVEEGTFYGKKTQASKALVIDNIKDELVNYFVSLVDYGEKYNTYNVVKKNIYPLALLNEIEKAYNEIKSTNNIVAISDFSKIISGIVSKEPVPFVYERIGEKYDHYLIDEFQDTSVLQWNNLLPLIHNTLSKGKFNMLVGDAKQAIYRFRSGDVEQFVELPDVHKKIFRYDEQDEKALLSSLKDNFNEKFLSVNYRSKSEIVSFNNDFFKQLSDNLAVNSKYVDIKKVYESVFQNIKPGNTGGFVSVEFLETEKLAEDDANLLRIKGIVEELQVSGYNLKDIAILCRKNLDANKVARFLIGNNIKVVSNESLLLSSSVEVKFIVDLTVFLLNPANMLARSSIIDFLINSGKLTGSFDEYTKLICSENPKEFLELIKQGENDFRPDELVKMPYYELVEEVLMYFGFNVPNPYIQHFLDCALDFTVKSNRGFNDFLVWWDENKKKKSVVIPEGINAVRIMTIHKSKGLEFPIVIYPYANEKIDLKRSFDFVEFDDENFPELKKIMIKLNKSELLGTKFYNKYQEEEEKYLLDIVNLLYVTLTRGTDRVYVLTDKFKTEKVERIDSVPKFFWDYLVNKGMWTADTTVYEFGAAEINVSNEKNAKTNEPENIFLDKIITSNWKKNINIRYKAPEFWDLGDPEKSKTWGNLIHYILAEITDAGEMNNVINRLKIEGAISIDNIDLVREKVSAVINHTEIGRFFEKGVLSRSEAEIVDALGISHRPDRLILDGDKAIIIDYKTGLEREYHKDQVSKYAELLKNLGYAESEKFLVYINDDIKVLKF